MKSLGGCICVCHWLCHLQPSFSTLKIILLLHSSLTISRTNFVSCKTRWLNGSHTAVNRCSIWWIFPLPLLWHQLYVFLRPQHHLVIFCSGLWTPQSGEGSRVCWCSLQFVMCWFGHTQRWCYGEPFSFGERRLWIWVPSSSIHWVGTEVQYIAPWRCPWTVVHVSMNWIRYHNFLLFSFTFPHSLFSEVTSLSKHHASCPSSLPVLSRAAWAQKSCIYPARYSCHKPLCPS